ncbi:MAG: amidohydrolase [Desulfobulbales bacterium]|nr:amidohydrolase [Desulfobulbales bacterium]
MNCDLLIKNGLLQTPDMGDPGRALPGFVAIRDGLISACGPMAALADGIRPAVTIDAAGGLVLPGLINCHNHAAMTLFRGLADDLPLLTWLHDHIFPAEARFVTPEMVYWCGKLAAAEMILSGTTTVADGYFFEDDCARAFREAGLRAVAAQGVIDFPAPGVPDPADNIRHGARFIDKWRGDDLITPAIFCHSPYTCSAQTITQAKELARQVDCCFFIHLAETEHEVAQSYQRHHLSPVRYLEQLGVLDQGTVLIHCVWLDDDDIGIIKESGAGVVSCSQSNMKLAAGMAPLDKFVENDIPVGLGTDSCASNNKLDMFREMTFAAKLAKVNRLDPTLLPAGKVVKMATTGGAAVLGLADKIGQLTVGRSADIIIVDLLKPHLTPMYETDSLLVYAASGSDVRTSIINGRLVMDNHELLTIDLPEVIGKVNELARRLRSGP